MRKSKKMLSALLALSFAFAAGGAVGAVVIIGARDNEVAAYADEMGTSIDVTDTATITDVNASWWENEYNAYWLKISLGGKNLLPKDGGSAYYANDHATQNGMDWAEYIYINDVSIRYALAANADGTTSYKGKESPMSIGGVFAPVTIYVNNTEVEIKILKDYVNSEKNFEITLKGGVSWENSDGEVLTTTKDITYDYESGALASKVVRTDVSLNGAFSVRSTQVSTGDSKIYTIDSNVKFFGDGATWLMDHYTELQNYILVNGKTVTEINAETDDSAYKYTEFPGNLGGVHAVPVRVNVGFENEATRINVYIHNDYLSANEIVSIGVQSGFEMRDSENAYKATEDRIFYAYDNTFAEKCKVYFDDEETTGYIGHGIPAASVPSNPSKESTATTDYMFSGWYDEKGNAWNWDTKLTGDVKLVSHYNESARKYTITYYNEDGTVFETREVANGESISLIATPEKTGYTAKWSATQEYATMPTEDISYTVEYEVITYTIVFEADGKTVATKTYTIENDDVEEPTVPDKDGYTGEWDSYTKFSAAEIVVRATYTLIEDDQSSGDETSDSTPDESSSDETSDSTTFDVSSSTATASNKKNGCSGSVSCLPVVAIFGFAAALLKKKRK